MSHEHSHIPGFSTKMLLCRLGRDEESFIQFKPSKFDAPLVMDSERSEYREAISQLLDFARRRDMFICGHHDRLMAYDATLLAMGFYEVLGCATAGELARRYRVIRWLGQAACREKT